MTDASKRMGKWRERLKEDEKKYAQKLAKERERARRHRAKIKAVEGKSPAAIEERRRKDAERQRRCRERKKESREQKKSNFISRRSQMKREFKPKMAVIRVQVEQVVTLN